MGKKGSVKGKSRNSSVKSFFFGSFIGFLLCLVLISGIGLFAYYKVSPNWINKTFKTDIDLGNDEINSKTLKDFIGGAIGLIQNADNYTLNDLKDDFGINVKDEFYGIDIKDLKNVALTDLPTAIEEKFASISAQELRNMGSMNWEDMGNILDKTTTYYLNLNDSKLYEEFDGTNYKYEADFNYDVNANKSKITIKSYEFAVVSQKVEIQLWYLPLTTAISRFSTNLGDKMTLLDLEKDYGVDLPSYFDNIDKSTPINNLEEEIKLLKLADFLGYKINGGVVYKDVNENNQQDSGEEIVGIMAKLAKVQVQVLDNIKETVIDTSTVAEIMGYYEDDGVYYTDQALTNPVTGVMKAAAGKTVADLPNLVDDLYLTDVFDDSDFEDGKTLSILKGYKNTKVVDMANTLKSVMNDLTINDLYTSRIITLTGTQIAKLDDEVVPGVTLGSMNIMDIVIAYIDSL